VANGKILLNNKGVELFFVWFQYAEDLNAAKDILGFRYPEVLCEAFLKLDVDKEANILDVACGPGNVAQIVSSEFK
jgi:ubiquinone/menaquinone biosynthesis C-methylase UbiE